MESLEVVEISVVLYGDIALSPHLEEGSGDLARSKQVTSASWCFFPKEYNESFTLQGINYALTSEKKKSKKRNWCWFMFLSYLSFDWSL